MLPIVLDIDMSHSNNPLEYNEMKRKRMGSPVQQSFMHPKIIKTDKIQLQPSYSTVKKKTFNQPKPQSEKAIKHKFQFV